MKSIVDAILNKEITNTELKILILMKHFSADGIFCLNLLAFSRIISIRKDNLTNYLKSLFAKGFLHQQDEYIELMY